MKNTKGKWVAHQIEETDEFAIFSLNTFIAQTENPMINEEPTKSEKQANANLIASAPEMLQELKAIELGLNHTDSDWAKERLGYVRKIIARAEGE